MQGEKGPNLDYFIAIKNQVLHRTDRSGEMQSKRYADHQENQEILPDIKGVIILVIAPKDNS
jgi:hypothetical protein